MTVNAVVLPFFFGGGFVMGFIVGVALNAILTEALEEADKLRQRRKDQTRHQES